MDKHLFLKVGAIRLADEAGFHCAARLTTVESNFEQTSDLSVYCMTSLSLGQYSKALV